jgi:hypothetical protein
MAVNQPVDINKQRTRVLKNGAIYDMDTKRIVANPGGGASAITKQNASEMQAQRQAKKRETIAAAANQAVERSDYRTTYGDLAYVAALAETAYIKATTADDPKAIDAARFLLQETGLSEKQAEQAQQVTNNVLVLDDTARNMIARLLSADNACDNYTYHNHSIIDADSTDTQQQAHDTHESGQAEAEREAEDE